MTRKLPRLQLYGYAVHFPATAGSHEDRLRLLIERT